MYRPHVEWLGGNRWIFGWVFNWQYRRATKAIWATNGLFASILIALVTRTQSMVNDRIVLSFKWVLSLDVYSGHEWQVMAMGSSSIASFYGFKATDRCSPESGWWRLANRQTLEKNLEWACMGRVLWAWIWQNWSLSLWNQPNGTFNWKKHPPPSFPVSDQHWFVACGIEMLVVMCLVCRVRIGWLCHFLGKCCWWLLLLKCLVRNLLVQLLMWTIHT